MSKYLLDFSLLMLVHYAGKSYTRTWGYTPLLIHLRTIVSCVMGCWVLRLWSDLVSLLEKGMWDPQVLQQYILTKATRNARMAVVSFWSRNTSPFSSWLSSRTRDPKWTWNSSVSYQSRIWNRQARGTRVPMGTYSTETHRRVLNQQ